MALPPLLAWIASLGLTVFAAGIAIGQGYPNRPIRIVTNEAGGGTDFVARLVAQGLTSSLGQQVLVDNRGGSVIIPVELASKAPPDGYTLLLSTNFMWLLPLLQKVPYDVPKDFVPITVAASSPNIIVVHPSLPVKSVVELIALAKRKPGALNCATGPIGSPSHLAPELFKALGGINIVTVPHKGGGPAILSLLGGQVHLMFASSASVAPHIQSGKVRPLAVTTSRSSKLFPHLPTVAESGLPGYEMTQLQGIFVPAGTPAPIINQLSQNIVRFLQMPDIKEKFLKSGVETVGNSSEEFASIIKSDISKWGKVIKDAQIRAE